MNRRAVLAVGVVACCAAAALIAVLVVVAASGSRVVSGAGSSTPQAVAAALLGAIERDDTAGINGQLCDADRRNGAASIMRTDQLRSFTVDDATASKNGTAVVRVTLVEPGASGTIRLPVVRERGQWKVCLTRLGATGSTPSSTPPPMSTAPLPPPPPNFRCASDITGFETAESYIDFSEFGGPYAPAQACVWRHSVPLRVTRLIGRGHPFYQTDDNSGTGPVVHYHSPLRRVIVTISREPDGYFYVTDVTIRSR